MAGQKHTPTSGCGQPMSDTGTIIPFPTQNSRQDRVAAAKLASSKRDFDLGYALARMSDDNLRQLGWMSIADQKLAIDRHVAKDNCKVIAFHRPQHEKSQEGQIDG